MVADADPLISHIAIQALISFEAADVCLAALDKENTKVLGGALRVLQSLHDKKVVDGLFVAYDQSSANRAAIFTRLVPTLLQGGRLDRQMVGHPA